MSPQREINSPMSSGRAAQKTRRIQELYDVTRRIDGSNEEDFTMFCLFTGSNPISFEEAHQEEKWRLAMHEEIQAIERNNTWELTSLPEGHKEIGVKWVYKIKRNAKGEVGNSRKGL